MPGTEYQELAAQLMAAKKQGSLLERPSAKNDDFDMVAAYSVGSELTYMFEREGLQPNGRKIGFTNPALWPRLGLDSVIWAHTYNSTVIYAAGNQASLSLSGMVAPKIEPEIVVKLKTDMTKGSQDAAEILGMVEWMALGFEIVDCNYANWRFKAADMVADFGFHAALIIGEPFLIRDIETLVKQFPDFTLKLSKNGEVAAEGGGKNVMGSPILSLGSVADIVSRQGGQIAAGEVVTTGTLTDAMFIAAGETWQAQTNGLDLPALSITFFE